MCGIFGFSKWDERTRFMAPLLAKEMERRGTQSWGVTNGDQIRKQLGKITKTDWLELLDEIDGWGKKQPVVFHTRQASTGKVNLENQHPFVFESSTGTRVVGVHNGIICSHEALNKEYKRTFECDSMHIFAHLAEGRKMEDIRGYGAVVYFENMKIRLTKFNMYDLHIAKLDDLYVFCSTRYPIDDAADMLETTPTFYELVDNEIYFIEGGEMMVSGTKHAFPGRYEPKPLVAAPYVYNDAYRTGNYEHMSNTTNKKDGKKRSCKECYKALEEPWGIVCEGCLDKIMEDVEKMKTSMVYQ